MRVKGRPDLEWAGSLSAVLPAGRKELPSPALGITAGGETPTEVQDPKGTTSQEHLFEIRVSPEPGAMGRLMPGQVVIIRFETTPKPLLAQGWRALRQLFQRRFHV